MTDPVEESEEDRVRADLLTQLRESLARSRGMMLDENLDAKTRERWTQLHTKTAQVLNQILRDRQLREWEKRLKEIEASGQIPRKLTGL
jgi:aspartate/tyrosine/aromatic aminotransferase